MALPNFTTQDATTYKVSIDATAQDHEDRIGQNETALAGHETRLTDVETNKINASRFPNVDGDVNASDEELNMLAGKTGTVWTSDNDGDGSGLDADAVKGKHIFHGSVTGAGSVIYLPPGWSVARLGTGYYQITHNMGLAQFGYVVIGNLRSDIGWFFSDVRGSNGNFFNVSTVDSGTGTAADIAFEFIVVTN